MTCGSLYLQFTDFAEAAAFCDATPGFELMLNTDAIGALYGGAQPSRQSVTGGGEQALPDMPAPYPALIGYDGMPNRPEYVGVAMKAEDGIWVPVLVFDPPLSSAERAQACIAALANHWDRMVAAGAAEVLP